MERVLKYEGPWGDVDTLLELATGEWRTHRPIVNKETCVNCGWCYLYCPPGCFCIEDEQFVVDLQYCKGCGICSEVCPVTAITMTAEE